MTRHIVFDTETTGLSPENGDRIVEIGCVELVNRKPTGRHLHLYLNPERESDEGALRVHGLTTEFLSDKPKFAEVADEFLAFTAGADIVIHNAPFDLGFINHELARLGKPPFEGQVASIIDTLAMAKEMYPGKNNSLNGLCSRLDVDNSGRTLHGALLDAELLAEVYINLTRGQDALLIGDEAHANAAGTGQRAGIDLSALQLHVLSPSPEELAAHAEQLQQLDKASNGKTIWRTWQPQPEAVT